MNLFNLHVSLVNFSMCAFIHFPSSIFVLFHFSILQDLGCKATYSMATFSFFHGNSSYLYLYHNVIVHCDMSFSNSQKKTFSLFFYLPLCLEGIQKLLLNFGIMEFFLQAHPFHELSQESQFKRCEIYEHQEFEELMRTAKPFRQSSISLKCTSKNLLRIQEAVIELSSCALDQVVRQKSLVTSKRRFPHYLSSKSPQQMLVFSGRSALHSPTSKLTIEISVFILLPTNFTTPKTSGLLI